MKLSLLIGLALVALTLSSPVKPKAPKADDVSQLLRGIVPEHYALTLTTHTEAFDGTEAKFTYEGEVVITLKIVDDNIKDLILHSGSTITLGTPKLTTTTPGTPPTEDDVVLNPVEKIDPDKIKFTIQTGDSFVKGQAYTLTIPYTGTHGKEMAGFYRSSYTVAGTPDPVTKWLVTTQFEQMDARKAFPCFDEPFFKAKYDIVIKISKAANDAGYHALSNTPLVGGAPTQDNGMFVYTFEPTPERVSSYLIAFIVSDFKSSAPATFDTNKEFKTWGQSAYTADSALIQDYGPKLMNWYNTYLKEKYPYQKVDQVGIPDFSAGAMENWGLTTYRERMVFFNKDTGTDATMQSNVAVTAHELAHQWFGDLVTLSWWDNIWLNEGFATYFEYFATAGVASDWDMEGQMLVEETYAGAFETDGKEKSRPLNQNTDDPDTIKGNFDDIAYAKGGSVLRMLRYVLKDKVFQDSLTLYLQEHRTDVATHVDLMQAFDDTVTALGGIAPAYGSVKDLLTNWVTQAGYPVLKVEKNKDDAKKYTISQERFLWTKPATADTSKWMIPITFTINKDSNTDPSQYLKPADKTSDITVSEESDWIIVNNKGTGFYRVNYEKDIWESLANEMESDDPQIHAYNRAQLIEDSLSLARSTQADHLDYETAMRIVRTLKKEKEFIPWKAGLSALSFLSNKLANSEETLMSYKYFVRELVADRYEELGLEQATGDNHLTRMMRIQIATWACKYGLEKCIEDAINLYEGEFPAITTTESTSSTTAGDSQKQLGKADAPAMIPGDVRGIVLSTVVREYSDDDNVFNNIKAKITPDLPNIAQLTYLSALGATNKSANLISLLKEIFIDETLVVKAQDYKAAIGYIHNGNPDNVAVFIKFVSDNLDQLIQKEMLGTMISSVASRVVRADDIKSIADLKVKVDASKATEDDKKAAADAVTTTESTKDWLSKRGDTLGEWFKDTFKSGASTVLVSTVTLLMSCIVLLFR